MATASSSSSSRTRSYKRSPVEYDYEGPRKYCLCRVRGQRLEALRKTSWTDDNPGRRYFGCRFFNVSGVVLFV